MGKRMKPHVKKQLVVPLEEFSRYSIARLREFSNHIRLMSPVDGIGCLGYLKKVSRDLRDESKRFVVDVDAHAARVRRMKEHKRQDRERLF